MTTYTSKPSASPRTITEINLARVLSRLSSTILSPSSSASSASYDELLHSHFARVRFAGNLEYARTLLLRLEHDSSAIKIQSRKHAAEGGLAKQRALIKRVGDALKEVEGAGDEKWDFYQNGNSGRDEEEEGEDEEAPVKRKGLLEEYDDEDDETIGNGNPAAGGGLDNKPKPSKGRHRAGEEEEPQNILRNRLLHSSSRSPTDTGNDTTTTTGTETSPQNTTTTTLLETATSTQETLTTSLLTLAQRLKTSTQSFSTALEADTAHLDRAVDGLDRNTAGMDAAAGKMGFLRRMSEGKGWWGRAMLYVWIGALWVLAILLVGVGPKLRF